ncbi:DUF3136 domain-containing protein [Halopseudomonas maritima]|nr:DUF3136 domain-containing protein [Halopseudomonas maritima]
MTMSPRICWAHMAIIHRCLSRRYASACLI